MDKKILKDVDQVAPLLEQICAVADANREIFGFLPRTAYEDLAARGQLWVVINPLSNLLGYLLFGSGKSRASIFQLYVNPSSRGHGIGSFLICHLKAYASARRFQIISARVAADLEANRFWEREGFHVLRQVAGGETTGRLINVRVYELAGCSLWDAVPSSGQAAFVLPPRQPILAPAAYALDLNVLFDVTKDREHAALMRDVLASALNNEYRLSVTSEFTAELERSSVGDDPILQLARSLPTLPVVPSGTVDALITELRPIIFPEAQRSRRRAENDNSDLKHLAVCMHHRVSGFITRESAILRQSRLLLERYGVEALSPADLSAEAQRERALTPIRADVAGSILRVSTLNEGDRRKVELFLRDQGVQDQRLRVILNAGTTSSPRARAIFYLDSAVVGFASWGPLGRQTRGFPIYVVVDETVPAAQNAVDHALETVSRAAPKSHMVKVDLMTARNQIETRETARKRGFVLVKESEAEDGFMTSSRYIYRRVISEENWPLFAADLETVSNLRVTRRCPTYSELTNTGLLLQHRSSNETTPVRLFELETAFAPVIVVTKGRPGVIVPIQDQYASELIALAAKQAGLFAKEAPAHLERAYFGRPGIERWYSRGAIVVFYISGSRNEAVGFGRVTSGGRFLVDEARVMFARQGVLTTDELARMSVKNEIGVFTFDSYRNFERPIPFGELRSRGIIGRANLVTSQAISYEQLKTVIALGEVQ
jgi:GNAT superfamily N-acetyltransferase